VNTVINLGNSQADKLSQILSKHLSRSSQGKEIISKFREDREQGREALLAYLNARLPANEMLTKQIADALGEEYGARFITIVAGGGSVGEIINVGQLDKLDIHYYVFSSVWQVLTVLLGVVIIGSIVSIGIWWFRQPQRMTGDFNIAVAKFVQTGEADSVAPVVSQRIFSMLDGQYKLSSFEVVQVAHDKIGVITNAEEASALAKKINAHLVIYGDVTLLEDKVLVTPQFYVAEMQQSNVGEVNGEHKLAARIRFSKKDLVTPSNQALEKMQQSTTILIEFTKALVYLTAGTPGDLTLARESIGKAIGESKRYGNFEGKEILYVFASDIARRQSNWSQAQEYLDEAMRLNDKYGRAYIAEGNIYYDQGNLYQAMYYYNKAKSLANQPFGAYVTEKASLGIGNSCSTQYQHVHRDKQVDQAAAAALANCALENYQVVITSYNQQTTPEFVLKEMAAWSYYGSGIVYQEANYFANAQQVYEEVLNLTTNSDLLIRARGRLDEVKGK
jgi:tetratricopeptide (TPR) repeat protein